MEAAGPVCQSYKLLIQFAKKPKSLEPVIRSYTQGHTLLKIQYRS